MNDYQSVPVCDNILYAAEYIELDMFNIPEIKYTLDNLVEFNHESLGVTLLALSRISRSMIALIEVDLREYISRDNCNDTKRYNIQPLATFG